MNQNVSINSVDAARMHGRRYEHLLASAGYSPSVMDSLRRGFQQIQIQGGINAIMPSGNVAVNDNSIQITNPAGPGTNFLLGGDINSLFDFSTSGGSGVPGPPGPAGATGPAGPAGSDGAPGSGAFWEDGLGTTLNGDGASSGTAYSIDIDTSVATTVDSIQFISGISASLSATKLTFTLTTKKLEISYNDGGAVVSVAQSNAPDQTVEIDVEAQSCPDPC